MKIQQAISQLHHKNQIFAPPNGVIPVLFGNAFIRFMRYCGYHDPATTDRREIVKYLGRMIRRGLSPSTVNNCVNALNIYYRELLQIPHVEIDFPGPGKGHKLPAVIILR